MLTAKDYETAIVVQDACNLSGVVHAWSEIIPRIWEDVWAAGEGTDAFNRHPINVMFSSKVESLTLSTDFEIFGKAYTACKQKADVC